MKEQKSSEIEQDNENIQNPPVTVLRRSERLAKKGAINCSCVASNVSSDEPLTVEEALLGDQHSKWLQAMNDEINSLVENRTWTETNLPDGKTAVKTKWIFKKKSEPNNAIRFKARLVAKGYNKQKGIDFEETYSPVVRYTSIQP